MTLKFRPDIRLRDRVRTSIVLERDTLDRVDALAKAHNANRSEVIRKLIERGLESLDPD